MTKNEKALAYYLGLKYPITIIPENEGYSITVPDLPGCTTQGETLDEALANIMDAKRGWLEVALEEGIDIPEPDHDREYSGKFVVRVAKSIHKALAIRAKKEGVSLNQYVNLLLSLRDDRRERAQQYKELKEMLTRIALSGVPWDTTSQFVKFGEAFPKGKLPEVTCEDLV